MCRGIWLHLHTCLGKCSKAGSCCMAIKMLHSPRRLGWLVHTKQRPGTGRCLSHLTKWARGIFWSCGAQSVPRSVNSLSADSPALNKWAYKLPHWFHSRMEKCSFDRFLQISQELSCLIRPALGTTIIKVKKTFCTDQWTLCPCGKLREARLAVPSRSTLLSEECWYRSQHAETIPSPGSPRTPNTRWFPT